MCDCLFIKLYMLCNICLTSDDIAVVCKVLNLDSCTANMQMTNLENSSQGLTETYLGQLAISYSW